MEEFAQLRDPGVRDFEPGVGLVLDLKCNWESCG